MANGNKMASAVMAAILAVVIGGILIGYVFPIGINAANTDQTSNITQEIQTEYEVTDSVVTNVTNVNSTNGVDYTVTDTETGESATFTNQNIGENQTLSWQEGTIEVSVENYDATSSPETATLSYQYPPDYGWSSGESDIYNLLPIFLVLIPLAVLAAFVMRSF